MEAKRSCEMLCQRGPACVEAVMRAHHSTTAKKKTSEKRDVCAIPASVMLAVVHCYKTPFPKPPYGLT